MEHVGKVALPHDSLCLRETDAGMQQAKPGPNRTKRAYLIQERVHEPELVQILGLEDVAGQQRICDADDLHPHELQSISGKGFIEVEMFPSAQSDIIRP